MPDANVSGKASCRLNGLKWGDYKTLPNSPEVFLFDKLVEGIQHFAKNNNIDLDIELTEDELDEITDEEQALIIADQIREFNERSSIGIAQSIASQMAALNDFESFKNSMTAQSQWGGDVYRALQAKARKISKKPPDAESDSEE